MAPAHSALNRTTAAELRAELARRNLTIAEASDIIGVHVDWLSRRVSKKGHTRITLDDLELISAKLGVGVVELINPRREVA